MKIGKLVIRPADIEYCLFGQPSSSDLYTVSICTRAGRVVRVDDVSADEFKQLEDVFTQPAERWHLTWGLSEPPAGWVDGSGRVSVTQPKRHAYDPVADLPPDVRAKYEYLPEPKKVTIRMNWDAEPVSYILEWGNRMVRTGDDLTKLVEQSYEAYWDALVSHAAQTVVQQHPSDKQREIVAQVLGSQQFEGPNAQRERDIVVIARQVAESMRASISMVTHLGSQSTTSEVKANRDKCAAMVESVVAEVLKALWTGQ